MFNIDRSKPTPPPSENSERRSVMNEAEWEKITAYLVGTQQRFRENIIIPRTVGPVQIKTNEEKRIERVMESCAFKSLCSCCIGMFIKQFIIRVGITNKKLCFQDIFWEV